MSDRRRADDRGVRSTYTPDPKVRERRWRSSIGAGVLPEGVWEGHSRRSGRDEEKEDCGGPC
jgi:hypothetical protein